MLLVGFILLFSLIQLRKWLPQWFTLESRPAAEKMEFSAESYASTGEGKNVDSSDIGLSGPDVLPPAKEEEKPVSTEEEEYDDMEDGLLGGLWNLNSALQFGQEYEWIYKVSENASLELGDASLAALYNQASGLLTELCATILLKYSQFTSMDGYDDEQSTDICSKDAACGRTEDNSPAKKRKMVLDSRSADRAKEQDEQITAVEPDDLNPAIQWGLRRKDVEAEKQRKLDLKQGFSFSAAGLLFPYYLGVSECLKEHNYITEDTPLAGSSAGALVCAVVAGGLDMRVSLEATKELGKECREGGTAFKLGAVLRVFLNKFLPEDAHLRANGRIRVSITQLFGSPRGLLVDQFDSKEDLLDALLASCHIPLYFASWPVTLFRNRICVDGGLSFFMPPTSAKHTVRISAFPGLTTSLRFGEPEISPDCNPLLKRPSLFQLVRWALVPAEGPQMEHLFELGYQDALVWCRKQQPTC